MTVVVDNGKGTSVTKSSSVRKTNGKAKRKTSPPKKPKAASKAQKSKTTYTKAVIEANQKHILSYFTPDEFVEQIRYLGRMPPYKAMEMMVDGGMFLVYHEDVRKYLSSIGVKGDRKYTNEESWNLYKHLLARDGSKLYESLTQKNKSAPKTAKPAKSKNTKRGCTKKSTGKCSKCGRC